jgi:tetratricopeptide (TPR) repeat protein
MTSQGCILITMRCKMQRRIVLCLIFLLPFACNLVAQPNRNAQVVAHFKQAEAALAVGQADKAAEEFREILKLDPSNAGAYANLGVIAYKSGDFEQAKTLFEDALKRDESLWDAKAFLGFCQMRTGAPEAGIALLEQSFAHIKNNELRINVGVALIQAHEESKTLDQAIDVVRTLQQTDPHNQEVLYVSYRVYLELATQALSTLSKDAPDSGRVHQILGESALMQEDMSGAVEQFKAAIKADPTLPGIHFQLGHALVMNSSSLEEAQHEFEAAIASDPSDYRSECELGEILRLTQRPELAESHFEKALRINPNYSDAQVGLGDLLLDAAKSAEAVEHLVIATRLDPNNETAHYHLSKAYRELGRAEEANREMLEFKRLHAAHAAEHPIPNSSASGSSTQTP